MMTGFAFPSLRPPAVATPGQLLARGACRCLIEHGFACLTELVPRPGLRVDVMALGRKGEIWVVECKSSRADFTSDRKWQGYLDYADRFFWAVDADFPIEILPEGSGLIVADRFGGEILRMAPEMKLAPARRRVVTQGFARAAALRLARHEDGGHEDGGRENGGRENGAPPMRAGPDPADLGLATFF